MAMAAPLFSNLLLKGSPVMSNWFLSKDVILGRMAIANDSQVAGLLQSVSADNFNFSRKIGYDFSALAASYCFEGSIYFHIP